MKVSSDRSGAQSDCEVSQEGGVPDARWRGGGTIRANVLSERRPPCSYVILSVLLLFFFLLRLNKMT